MSPSRTDPRGNGLGGEPHETTPGPDTDATVLRAVTEAQRRCLMALRAGGTIVDAAFQRVEEELDWAELQDTAP